MVTGPTMRMVGWAGMDGADGAADGRSTGRGTIEAADVREMTEDGRESRDEGIEAADDDGR